MSAVSNQPCRRCSAIAAALALAFLLLSGPVIIRPLAAYFRPSAPVLAQAQ